MIANALVTGTILMPASHIVSVVAVVLGFTGLWLRVWGVGMISAETMVSMKISTDRLVTGGVYGLVRNPLYLGDLLLFLGYSVLLTPSVGAAFMTFHIVRTLRLIRFEEATMASRYGAAFAEYVRQVPRLLPRIMAPPPASVDWREGFAASVIWAGFAVGYVAVLIVGDVWALTPFETAGFLAAAVYFSRARRGVRRSAGA